jgi:predicted RNA-binding protein YlxR (DUF448 family)
MVKQSTKTKPGSTSEAAPVTTKQQASGKKGSRPKHVPQRTCIACRSTDAKRQLIRLVRTPEGQVEIDETGKKNGRGAYLCRTRECWDIGLAKKALDNALKITIDPENRARLKAFGETLPERSAVEVE